MITWIVIIGMLALIASSAGAHFNGGSGRNAALVLLGIVMLVPGLCGSFFLGLSLLGSRGSSEEQAYMTIFASIAVPSIQVSCLLLWLMARRSDVAWLRKLTHYAGWYGAFAAGFLMLGYVQMAMKEHGTLLDKAMFIGIGLLIAGVPFLIGGLQAIRLSVEPEKKP